jgi:predicted DNA-binding transcriptional regulator AlpA
MRTTSSQVASSPNELTCASAQQSPAPRILTVKDAMQLTGLSKTRLYEAMKHDGLPSHNCGKRCRRFLEDELISWVRSRPAS